MEAHHRLRAKLEGLLNGAGVHAKLLERKLYFGKDIALDGTARFGTDPASSVLDLDFNAHEFDNLYVTDASFFVPIGAVNPMLTIIANSLRVAAHIAQRLRVPPQP
jgi:choline dehydrogenase-like flavoprotein